jgi:signal transduction histidine kinase
MPIQAAHRENPLSQIATPAMLLLAAVVWTLLVLFSLWTQREQLNRTAMELARIDAIANLKKDMAIRKWASEVGGVYIKEDLAPNVDALSEQERVVAVRFTGESHKLISLTSIHILMGIQEVSNKEYGSKERLTSLQLLNRKNAPDEWEAQALKTLEQGSKIVAESMPRKKGHGLMRVMIPMRMDEECLECHRETLVPVGGLRGGAAVTIDLNTYWTAQEPAWRGIQYWHTGIWFAGLAALLYYWTFVRRRAAEHMLIESERRENEAVLQQHKQRLEESEIRLRELAAFLETVREEERTRIARELHDELGQALTALRFDLGWLRGKCGANASLGATAAERVAAALGVVEQSIVSLRRISEDLRPAMLDSLGLAAAVEHHVTQFAQRNGLPCRLQMNREEFELDGNLATAVFRIVQEALTNVARHAEASEVLIRIDQEATPPAGIRLTVEDDGRGFDTTGRTSRFGLLGMRERIAMLGGTLAIESQPDRGTRIVAWLPLQKESTP